MCKKPNGIKFSDLKPFSFLFWLFFQIHFYSDSVRLAFFFLFQQLTVYGHSSFVQCFGLTKPLKKNKSSSVVYIVHYGPIVSSGRPNKTLSVHFSAWPDERCVYKSAVRMNVCEYIERFSLRAMYSISGIVVKA